MLLGALMVGNVNAEGRVLALNQPQQESAPFTQTIDKIYINIGDVFDPSDPKEDKLFYRLANKLHINTRESVIRDLLLFKSGDKFTLQKLAESERLLRAQRFILDARIQPINVRPDKVDVQVFTRDSWTLSGGASFSHEGGESKSSIELDESNFLGSGKRLAIKRKTDFERTEQTIQYQDPNVKATRYQFSISYSDNSDGRETDFSFVRPFYAIDTKKSHGLTINSFNKIEPFFDDSDQDLKIRHKSDFYEAFIGYSYSVGIKRTLRMNYGYTFEGHRFFPLVGVSIQEFPEDARESFPWVKLQYVEDRFVKMKQVDYLNRTEDINLGQGVEIRFGWSDQSIGAKSEGLIVTGKYNYTKIVGDGKLVAQSFNFDGRYSDPRWENSVFSSQTRFYERLDDNTSNYVSISLDYGRHLQPDTLLVIGGDSGLRGYPLNLQNGDKRFLATYERRYYTDWHILRLAYLAAVAFFDVGRAWEPGESYAGNKGVMKDIGFGFRLSPSRSSSPLVTHFDVAIPLDGDDSVDDYQIRVKSSGTF